MATIDPPFRTLLDYLAHWQVDKVSTTLGMLQHHAIEDSILATRLSL
jgi:hypothetical protein